MEELQTPFKPQILGVEKILGFRYFVKTRAKPRGF
jgi:hypothetical protein